MAQYDFQIADYERIFRKQYKIVVLTIILSLVFSFIFAKTKPPLYRVAASVKVDRYNVMGLGTESFLYGTWDNIETQTNVISSFPVLIRAAKRLSLIADSVADDEYPDDERVLSVIEGLRGKISTTANSGTNIICISAVSGIPKEARDIANAVAFAYKEYSLDTKKLQASKTKQFVEEQLGRCMSELSTTEHEVKRFEESQKIPSIDANTSRIITQAAELDKKLKELEDAVATIAMEQAKLVRSVSGKAEPVSDGKKGVVKSDSTIRIAGMVDTVTAIGWVSQFTDADPGLMQLNNRLIQYQMQLNDQLAYRTKGHPAIMETEKRIKETTEQIVSVYDDKLVDLAKKKKKLLHERGSIEKEMLQLPSNELEYARLVRKLKVKEELASMLIKKLEESRIAEAGAVDDVSILSLALLPGKPFNKNLFQIASVGVLLGLLFGIIFAIIREMFDTSIGTIEDVERTLKLTVLAVIPHIHIDEQRMRLEKADKSHAHLRQYLVTHFIPKDPTAEAYRILRTNLEYLSFDRSVKTILLTSATMQEGKSTTIANLAVAFAQQGKKVLLLECNLRRPSMQKIFGTIQGPGTSDILIQKIDWRECVRSITDLALGHFSMEEILAMPGLDNFHIITYGHRPPNPTELISSKRMNTFLHELQQEFDMILVDAPPLLPVADSMVLSTKVDGVIMVYMVGKAPRNSLRLAKERLEAVQARILGLVLNDIRPETTGLTYQSYYMYAYSPSKEKKKKKRRHLRLFKAA
ncbi:MAG: polysaccharide biosynthesis tyrosine autokinase [Chitinispirillaceae bacterium]|nr:polysaccharide biosynthesis tyrosine autokinase [Chitinispirillaceae bacterium]